MKNTVITSVRFISLVLLSLIVIYLIFYLTDIICMWLQTRSAFGFVFISLFLLPMILGSLKFITFWLTKLLIKILYVKWATITIISITSVLWSIIDCISLWSYRGEMSEWNIFTSIVCTGIVLSVTFTIIISTFINYEAEENNLLY